jgi:hypothetical protein
MVRRIPHIVLPLLVWQSLLHAQPAPKDSSEKTNIVLDTIWQPIKRQWSVVGFGAGPVGLGIVAQYTFALDEQSISLRVTSLAHEYSPFEEPDSFNGYTIHYGLQTFERNLIGRVAIGGGYFHGKIKAEKISTFGGEFEVEGIWHTRGLNFITKHTDIGIGLIGTLSAGPKFFQPNVSLGFCIGNFR